MSSSKHLLYDGMVPESNIPGRRKSHTDLLYILYGSIDLKELSDCKALGGEYVAFQLKAITSKLFIKVKKLEKQVTARKI